MEGGPKAKGTGPGIEPEWHLMIWICGIAKVDMLAVVSGLAGLYANR
jgi:hypothetical protein